ncbi:hypothetical protein CR513_59892, partial [Mucuna pruriens]
FDSKDDEINDNVSNTYLNWEQQDHIFTSRLLTSMLWNLFSNLVKTRTILCLTNSSKNKSTAIRSRINTKEQIATSFNGQGRNTQGGGIQGQSFKGKGGGIQESRKKHSRWRNSGVSTHVISYGMKLMAKTPYSRDNKVKVANRGEAHIKHIGKAFFLSPHHSRPFFSK